MDNMDFALVEFTKDSSVEVVPSLWITAESRLCYWPPYKGDRLTKSIKKVEPPTDIWKCYAVRVLHYYESYNDARLKLRQAEDTSALDTEPDELATVKSREKRKKILTDEDEDNREQAQPDNLSAPLKKAKKPVHSFQATTLPTIPTSLLSQSALNDNHDALSVAGRADDIEQNIDPSDETTKNDVNGTQLDAGLQVFPEKDQMVEPDDSNSSSGSPRSPAMLMLQRGNTGKVRSPKDKTSKKRSNCSAAEYTGIRKSPRQKTASQTTLSTSPERKRLEFSETPLHSAAENRRQSNSDLVSSTNKASTEISSKVLSRLAILEAHQRQHTVLLQHILTALQKYDADESCDVPDGISLPLNSIKDIRNLEVTLDDGEKAKQLVRYLGSIGGKDVPDTTRRTMKTMMTNALAVRMNFEGRGDKVGMSHMKKCMNVIIRAVKRNRLCSKATRDDIETTVKLWLRYASDRAGGRNRRSLPKMQKRGDRANESGDSASE